MKRILIILASLGLTLGIEAQNPTSTIPLEIHTVTVDPAGILVSPTNFFGANGLAGDVEYGALESRIGDVETNLSLNIEPAITNFQGNIADLNTATNHLSSRIDDLVGEGGVLSFYRYKASATAGKEVEVLSNVNGITVVEGSSVFAFTIPEGGRVLSVKMRIDGLYTDGGAIYVDMGITDMKNNATATMWMPIVSCFREDTMQNVPVIARPHKTIPGRIVISGLTTITGVKQQIRLAF